MKKRSIFIGNSLATIVAAYEVAKTGAEIVVINPIKNWGGHFSSINLNDKLFDAGMILYEFSSPTISNSNGDLRPISEYNPLERNSCGKFFEEVKNYVEQFVQTHEISTPLMFMEGKYHKDALISNHLDFILRSRHFSDIKKELQKIVENPSIFHPSKKIDSNLFIERSYEEVSVNNHGVTLHNALIEPVARKILNLPTGQIIPRYHRVAWLPLFYPETILGSFDSNDYLEYIKTPFSYPNHGLSSGFTNQIFDKLSKFTNVKIENLNAVSNIEISHSGDYEITLSDGATYSSDSISWSLELASLTKFMPESFDMSFDKTSFAIFFAEISSKALLTDFSVLNIVDENYSVFRITNQSRCLGEQNSDVIRISCEINLDYLSSKYHLINDEIIQEEFISNLVDLNIVKSSSEILRFSIIKLLNALMLPTLSNMHKHEVIYQSAIRYFKNMSYLGPASGFFSSSFNDQILQGLKFSSNFKLTK